MPHSTILFPFFRNFDLFVDVNKVKTINHEKATMCFQTVQIELFALRNVHHKNCRFNDTICYTAPFDKKIQKNMTFTLLVIELIAYA